MITKIKTVQEFQMFINTYFGGNFKTEEHASCFLARSETFTISVEFDLVEYKADLENWAFSVSTDRKSFKNHLTFDQLYKEWKDSFN